MEQVTASIGTALYKTEVLSPTGNMVIADEPVNKGGQNMGFTPKELLASSLAACTCITLRMYADHKAWDVQKINTYIAITEKDGQTTFDRKISITGNIDEEQQGRMLKIANSCPVHKVLTHTIALNTQLV